MHLNTTNFLFKIQERLGKAQLEKRSLLEAVEQLKAQIAGNNASIVTTALEVSGGGNILLSQQHEMKCIVPAQFLKRILPCLFYSFVIFYFNYFFVR